MRHHKRVQELAEDYERRPDYRLCFAKLWRWHLEAWPWYMHGRREERGAQRQMKQLRNYSEAYDINTLFAEHIKRASPIRMQRGHVAVRWQRQEHHFSEHSGEPWAEADAETCPSISPWEELHVWAGGALPPPPACWLPPGSEHSTQRLSPTQHSKSHSHLPCLAAAPFIQCTTQGR